MDENKFEMMMLAHDAGLDDINLSDFQAALDAATADYATVPDVSRLETIRTRGHIKCAEGQPDHQPALLQVWPGSVPG